jgi:PEP-CTERM motif
MRFRCASAASERDADFAGTTTFNLDFTSSIPYASARTTLSAPTIGLDAGETLSFSLCPDLNGGGGASCFGAFGLPGPINSLSVQLTSSDAGFLDGTFSVVLTLNTGTVDIASVTASVLNAAGGVIASSTLIPSAVAEPATLALLGLGLFGVAVARRRSH